MRNNLMSKFIECLENILLRTAWGREYINKEYTQKIYFKKVKQQINFLKDRLDEPKFERDRDERFEHIVKSYERDYCPSSYYKYFNFENKLEYCYLRSEIDEILELNKREFIR